MHTDFNGLYEALEPSTDTFNCPVPAGPCPNMYRFVGNDPGQPGHVNSDYNPRFRTIAATFQGWPGLYTVTDEAPTQVANTVTTPDTTQANPAQCDLGQGLPAAVLRGQALRPADHRPRPTPPTTHGDRQRRQLRCRPGTLTLGSTTVADRQSWTDTKITFRLPDTTTLAGHSRSGSPGPEA